MSAYALRISNCPVCHPVSVLGPRLAWASVVGRFLSCQNFSIKRTPGRTLLDAGNPALRRRALAGRTHAADKRNPSLCLSLTVCYTQVIMLASADVSPVVGGNARAERTGARPSSAVVVKRADVWILLIH